MEEEAAEYLEKYNVQKKPVVGFIACVPRPPVFVGPLRQRLADFTCVLLAVVALLLPAVAVRRSALHLLALTHNS